jgi:hypothetical protein
MNKNPTVTIMKNTPMTLMDFTAVGVISVFAPANLFSNFMLFNMNGLYNSKIPIANKITDIRTMTAQNHIGISKHEIVLSPAEQPAAKALFAKSKDNKIAGIIFLLMRLLYLK